mmetsp:Transcript_32378/g.48071  ORF Transcript_32378/g.48071 Transcript_32378/m.48071 type:complete len:88 (-) Transcript_32378:112-375(-)
MGRNGLHQVQRVHEATRLMSLIRQQKGELLLLCHHQSYYMIFFLKAPKESTQDFPLHPSIHDYLTTVLALGGDVEIMMIREHRSYIC